MDRTVSRAAAAQIESIIRLDESVIGSRSRERMIREAVIRGQCHVIKTESGVAAFGILNYHFYGNGFIDLLIVGKEYRCRGLGRTLVESFREMCETDKLFTSTNSSNIPMQNVLDGCGFRCCGWIDLDKGDPELVYCFERKK